jgi:hypothetical protein
MVQETKAVSPLMLSSFSHTISCACQTIALQTYAPYLVTPAASGCQCRHSAQQVSAGTSGQDSGEQGARTLAGEGTAQKEGTAAQTCSRR